MLAFMLRINYCHSERRSGGGRSRWQGPFIWSMHKGSGTLAIIQTSGPVSVSTLWAADDLCWTALSQTISQNGAEEEPLNVSRKLINFSRRLSACACVAAREWERADCQSEQCWLFFRVLAAWVMGPNIPIPQHFISVREQPVKFITVRPEVHCMVQCQDLTSFFSCWAIHPASLRWQKATDAKFSQASRKQLRPAKNREKQMGAAERAE